LIVAFKYSKISLRFCKDCRIFCEGVKAARTNSNGFVDYALIGHNCLIDQDDLVDHNGLVNFIGLGLVGVIGLGLVSLIGQISLVGDIGLDGIIGLIGQTGLVGCMDPNGLVGLSLQGLNGLVDHNDLVGFFGLGLVSLARLIKDISLIGPSGISGLIGIIGPGLTDIVNHSGLIGLVSLVSIISLSLISHNVGFIGLGVSFISLFIGLGVSFIGGFICFVGPGLVSLGGLIRDISLIGFTSLGLISLVGLIGHISLVNLGSFSGINNYSLVKLISHINIFGLICFSGWLACMRKKMWWWIVSFGYYIHIDVFPYCLTAAILAAAAKIHGVTIKLTSATKITNAAILYYCAALLVLLSFICEGELAVTCAFYHRLDSLFSLFFRDALQNAKILYSTRLPQMMKYCVMRECENIHPWIPLSGDLVFVILKGISIF
jgi:hypothetical protein